MASSIRRATSTAGSGDSRPRADGLQPKRGCASGAAPGATAGHVVAGTSRSDLKDLGELLDAGTGGLIVVAATDVEGRVEAAIQRGKDIVKKQVQIDADGLKTEIDSL